MTHRYLPLVSALCRAEGWPVPEEEVSGLVPGRRFRCDLVWRADKVVVEVQGGAFVAGRHSRGMGQVKDFEKLNLLTLAGYRVLQITPRQVQDGTLTTLLGRVLTRARPGYVRRGQWETGQ